MLYKECSWEHQEKHLKTGFLSGTFELFADPAVPRITRTHSPRATLCEAFATLWGQSVGVARGANTGRGSAWAHSSCPSGVKLIHEQIITTSRRHIRSFQNEDPQAPQVTYGEEERVMLSLVSAYRVHQHLQCMLQANAAWELKQ